MKLAFNGLTESAVQSLPQLRHLFPLLACSKGMPLGEVLLNWFVCSGKFEIQAQGRNSSGLALRLRRNLVWIVIRQGMMSLEEKF